MTELLDFSDDIFEAVDQNKIIALMLLDKSS